MRMNKKFFETKDFKKLNKEWQNKLKHTGFKDMESQANIENDTITKQEFTVDPALIKYNYECELYLYSGKITDKLDFFIFEKHCEGVSNVEISRILGANDFPSLHSVTVDRRLIKILKAAGIKPMNFGSV